MLRLSTLALFATLTALASAASIWIEGESPSSLDGNPHTNGWWDSVRTVELSGGARLSTFAEKGQAGLRATYRFKVPASGRYELWVRLATSGHGYAWQLNDGARQPLDIKALRSAARQRENTRNPAYRPAVQSIENLASDGKADARYHGWVRLAETSLAAGESTLVFWLADASGTDLAQARHAALDALVLTSEPFAPSGLARPGEPDPTLITRDPATEWVFAPRPDTFAPQALLNLRILNEKIAGESGFVGLSADKMSFVRGDGRPLRFWAVNEYGQRDLNFDALKIKGAFLAKRGVNVVRWHGDLPAHPPKRGPGTGVPTQASDVDEGQLAQAFALVAAMKVSGIYTILSPFWGTHTNREKNWDIPDTGDGKMTGLVFFEPKTQAAYRSWLRALLTRPNPHTGIALKDEPAVALIQLQNEDSLLFWTFNRIQGEARLILRRQFADWLAARPGGLAAARTAWADFTVPTDDWAAGLPDLVNIWELSADAMQEKSTHPGFLARRAATLEFLAVTMHRFNEDTARFLRDELGCRQLINAGNWKTADPILLGDVERWTYAANDVSGRNAYFSSFHTGTNRGWQIAPGHLYANLSATREPAEIPTNVRQTVGQPFIIPESSWVFPNLYEAEGPLIVSTQQALSGVDAYFWFMSDSAWSPTNKGEFMFKWSVNTPLQFGQFPAAALIYRLGLVREADPVVIERRPPGDLWAGTPPRLPEEGTYDPNRDTGDSAQKTDRTASLDPWTFATGPVHVDFSPAAAPTRIAVPDDLIDRAAGKVTSATGEIILDTRAGLYLVRAPRAQGAAGFLGAAGPIELPDLTLDCLNTYASIVAVSLDARPLAESRRILVQIGTDARPEGWTERPITLEAGGRKFSAFSLLSIGAKNAPWRITRARGTLTLRNPHLARGAILDANGLGVAHAQVERLDGALRLTLPEDALYVILDGTPDPAPDPAKK